VLAAAVTGLFTSGGFYGLHRWAKRRRGPGVGVPGDTGTL
jgi:hypothetical protein